MSWRRPARPETGRGRRHAPGADVDGEPGASVLLARAAQREHEFAVSPALGASSAAVIRATLLEGGLLGLAGGAIGAGRCLGHEGPGGARAARLSAPRHDRGRLDCRRRDDRAWRHPRPARRRGSAAPGRRGRRCRRSSPRAPSVAAADTRMRRALVVTQVAITLVLLGSGGLVVRSVERLLRADPGFNAEGVLTFRVRSPPGILPAAGRSHRLPGSRRARACSPFRASPTPARPRRCR